MPIIRNQIIQGDALEKLKQLESESIALCITSPPYYKARDYKVENQIGWEQSREQYIEKLINIFAEVNRVLTKEGSLWINIADKIVDKTLLHIPERLAIALEDHGWYAPQTVIWNKSNAMPAGGGNGAVRFNIDFEYFYHFSKTRNYYFKQQFEPMKSSSLDDLESGRTQSREKYFGNENTRHNLQNFQYAGPKIGGNNPENYDNTNYSGDAWIPKQIELTEEEKRNAIKMGWDGVSNYADWYFNIRQKKGWHNHENDQEMGFGHQGRGSGKLKLAYPYGSIKRAVWQIAHAQYPDAHFATFPPELVETPIKACSKPDDIILDPFCGSGTVPMVALQNARDFIGIELNQEYINLAMDRLTPLLMQTRLTSY